MIAVGELYKPNNPPLARRRLMEREASVPDKQTSDDDKHRIVCPINRFVRVPSKQRYENQRNDNHPTQHGDNDGPSSSSVLPPLCRSRGGRLEGGLETFEELLRERFT